MVAMGRGGGKTPERVVKLINDEIAKIGQNATARAIGLPLYSIQKYMKGLTEPSQATLEKLGAYFKQPVAWLRGGLGWNQPLWLTKEETEGGPLENWPELSPGTGVIVLPFEGGFYPVTVDIIVPTLSTLTQYFALPESERNAETVLNKIEVLWKNVLPEAKEYYDDIEKFILE